MANPVVELGVTKTLVAWAERATKQGLDLSMDLQSSIDDSAEMQRLVRYIRAGAPIVPFSGIVYDAGAVSRILGLPCRKCSGPVPEAADGEIVVYYGGWDLQTLRTSTAGKKRMWQDQDWYEKEGWKAESGYYRLHLRVPGSNQKNWDEQLAHLRTIDEAAEAAPIAVAATALLVRLTETGNDLLENDWCRCAEPLPYDNHAGLAVYKGRVYVNDRWGGPRNDRIWLASSRLVVPPKS